MYNVLCVLPVNEEEKGRLMEAGGSACDYRWSTQEGVTREELEWADVLIGCVDKELLHDLPKLKFVQLDSAGSDSYAKLELFHEPQNCLLSNSTGAYGGTIAEYMIGSIIMLIRHFQVYRDHMKEHKWQRVELPTCITEHNALVIGLGDIGVNFAERMKALGCSVKAVRRTTGEKPDCVDEVGTLEDLPRLLPEADFVALCLPNTPQTQKIINRETLAMMKPSAILVNVGRGSAVDSDALAEALQSGRLGGAALDVTDPEPLPADHPLWDCRNCLVTPHVAGLFRQLYPFRRIVERSVTNLAHFVKGEPLESVVDLKTGYRVSRS
jgi:phosphoglycerate dehydrogenase-like enzyme